MQHDRKTLTTKTAPIIYLEMTQIHVRYPAAKSLGYKVCIVRK